MKLKLAQSILRILLPAAILFFYSCLEEGNPDDIPGNENNFPALDGYLIFPHAGDLFHYDLSTQSIDMIGERKGRQGPFFSPEGDVFVTNNWPGNNEGVAVWDTKSVEITKEFSLDRTLVSNQKGIKVAPNGSMFSAVLNALAGQKPHLIILDKDGKARTRINGEIIRSKGHTWDRQGNLYFTGEVLQGGAEGSLILARISDFDNPQIILIRSFQGTYLDLPDDLSISKDNKQITYAYKGDIWIGSTEENAADHRGYFESVQSLGRPVFSPDGLYVAMVMLNSSTSTRGDIHISKIPQSGSIQLSPDGPSKLPGPNSSLKSTWTSGEDSSIGWVE